VKAGVVWGRLIGAALSLMLTAGAAQAGTVLQVEHRADGRLLAEAPAPPGTGWCLRWRHSVTGGKVADCFRNDDGRMVLERSYLHDFAAGLGTVAGRGGRLVSAPGGGYWIEDISEPIANNALVLRVGARRVDHRIEIGGCEKHLSRIAPGARVVIRLANSDAG